ncbi:MAG: hypothetical protein ABSB80_08655 [Methanoregula sp.]|jgi:uncharacterized protein YdcH (DUF465 family)|uniref:hypothetical protein n=1 Tax=Methanoregula sp. TaxID=2052170 RepID=UPI003D128124
MNYFHDSSVILGYIFRGADTWGQQAYQRIEDPVPNHSSKYVWEECFGGQYNEGNFYRGKCGWIRSKIAGEGRRVILKIEQNIQLPDIISQMKGDDYKTTGLFEKLFSRYGSSPTFVQNLKEALIRFEALCFKRYCELNDEIKIKRHVRRKGYNDIYDHLKKYISNESDVEIVIDGHHLATQIQEVFFVTGDFTDIYSNKPIILEKTSLSDIIWLGNLR